MSAHRPGLSDSEAYRDALRTNEKDGDVGRLLSFTEAMANVTDDFELVTTVKEYTAATHMAR